MSALPHLPYDTTEIQTSTSAAIDSSLGRKKKKQDIYLA